MQCLHTHTDGRETYSDLSRREVKELHKAEIVASNQGGTGLGQGCAIHVGLKELSNSGGACIWNDKVKDSDLVGALGPDTNHLVAQHACP